MKYNFDRVIDRNNTNSYKHDSFKEKYDDPTLIAMSVADGDLEGCKEIKEAIIDNCKEGIFGYTFPSKEYYDTIREWYKRHFGFSFDNSDIVIVQGIVFGLALSIETLTNVGDSVMISEPVYHPFKRVIKEYKRHLVINELIQKEDNRYYYDFIDFENKIINENVKFYVLCSPHNPVGRVWEKEELKKICDICKKHHVLIFSDEIHSDFVFNDHIHHPTLTIDEAYKDFVITGVAPTKTFNLAGLCVSNLIIKNKEIKAKIDNAFDKMELSSTNMLSYPAVIAAYTKGEEWLREVKEYIVGNYHLVEKELKDTFVKINPIEGTYLAWLDFSYYDLKENLNDFIIHKCHLILNDGLMFGDKGINHMRMNLFTSRSIVKIALERIKAGLKELDGTR